MHHQQSYNKPTPLHNSKRKKRKKTVIQRPTKEFFLREYWFEALQKVPFSDAAS